MPATAAWNVSVAELARAEARAVEIGLTEVEFVFLLAKRVT